MARSEARSPWTTRHGPAALGIAILIAAAWPLAPPACAQRAVPAPAGRVEIVLDASGPTGARPGVPGGAGLAGRFVLALRDELDRRGDLPPMGLRSYGSLAAGRAGSCGESRLVVSPDAPREAWDRGFEGLQPGGSAPLALALERAIGDGADTYVLLAAGGDGCGQDACRTWERIVRERRSGRRIQLHVVAVDPTAEGREALHCLSRAGSGSFTVLRAPADVPSAAERLALVLRNEGLLDVRLWVGEERFGAPLRVIRPLTGEVVAAFAGMDVRPVPAGMYDLTVATTPEVRIERVLVIPGDTTVVERREFGRLLVEALGRDNEPRRHSLSLRRPARREEIRYAMTGDTLVLGAGHYEVRVEAGDSLLRRSVEVRAGRTARVTFGGTGTLIVEVPDLDDPPPDLAVAYGPSASVTLRVGEPALLPVGSYRLVVHTLPVYVTENVSVEAGTTTRIRLPEVGVLGVELSSVAGPERGIPAEVYEPLTKEVYGTLLSGERRLTMPGTYRLGLATVPPRDIGPVSVPAGEERIVARDGLSRIELSTSAAAAVRLEVLDTEGRSLAEGTGRRPSLTVWPGEYRVRVWQGSERLWEGDVTVAPAKSARIDWAPSLPVQPTGEIP
ncbi:MAG TPA: hypothetical protein VJP59_04175 [Gemmatimonadota bacterium]|nr:hypothetical protein [Gemmatimonadota bacterium]